MRNCVSCFEEMNSEGLRYPSWQYGGEKYIHKRCLLNKVQELCQDEKYEKMLKYIIAYEEEHSNDSWAIEYSGSSTDSHWSREDLSLMPHEVKKLLNHKVIGSILSTNNNSVYALCGRGVIKQYLSENKMVELKEQNPKCITKEIFSPIFDFGDIKENLVRAVNSGKRIHFLFEGPPATGAKTTFMLCLEVGIGSNCYHAVGSKTTGPGLTEALTLYQPRVLLLDEIEKVDKSALSVLLSVMETGNILETKHGKHGGVSVNTMVIAACNSSFLLPDELLSRFKPYHIKFKPYTDKEYFSVCESFLNKFEGVTKTLAGYIARKVYSDFGTTDVREARGISRMLINKTKEEVDEQMAFLKKYRKGRWN